MDSDQTLEPQDLKYTLKTHIRKFKTWVKPSDDEKKPKYERILLFLVPDQTTETQRFFDAWYPRGSDTEYVEIMFLVGSPVNSPARFAFMRPDARCERPYLVCMSPGVEEIVLKHKKENDILIVESQPQDMEEELNDQIIGYDAPIQAEED